MIILLLSFLFLQDSTPFKANDEFELKMDYEFRQRSADNSKAIDYSENKPKSGGPLPYLEVELKVLKVESGVDRIRIIDNKNLMVMNKKLKDNPVIKIDLGFTDDMKDRVSSHEYTISFLDEDKKALSKIVIFVAEDGTLLVNGEKRGKL